MRLNRNLLSELFSNGIDIVTIAKADASPAETAADWITTGNFISDDSLYAINVTENGTEAVLSKHRHKWEYTASGATITANCSECSASGGSVTIKEPAGSLTYGGKDKEATLDGRFTTGENPTIRYTSKDGEISYNVPRNAGDYKASITADSVTVSVDYTVEKAKLTVTANENTITYGDTPVSKGVSYKGFVNGEDENVLTGSLTYTFSYPRYGDTGLYIITPGGLTAVNYEIETVPGTLTVVPREVTLIWNNTENRIYGDGKLVTATAGNLVNGDVIEVAVSGGDYTAAGTHIAAATGLTGKKAGNYRLPDDDAKRTVTYIVIKGMHDNKELTMSVYKGVQKTYTYDFAAELPELASGLTFGDIQYTGTLSEEYNENWISKDTVVLKGSVLSITTRKWDEGTQILEYVVTVKSHNYENFTMTLKVNAKDKNVVDLPSDMIDMTGWSYGSSGVNEPEVRNVPAGATVSSVYRNKATGDVIIPTGMTDAGTYTVTVRYENDDTVYTGKQDFDINPKHLFSEHIEVPTGVTKDKIYDGKTDSDLTELGIDEDALVTPEDGALRIAGTSEYAGTNAGKTMLIFTTNGTIQLSDPSSSAKPSNYCTQPSILTKIFVANILQRKLAFTADSVSKIYGSDDTAAEVAVSFLPVLGKDKTGLVDGETLVQGVDYDVTAVFSKTEAGEDSNVRVIVTLKDTQKARNYELNVPEIIATGTINPKSISDVDLYLDKDSFIYNGGEQKPNITVKMNDTVLTENMDYTVTCPTDMTNVGTKEIKIKGIGNFSGEKTVSYQINKATVKVKPKDISTVYGDEPEFKLESGSPLITEAALEKVADSAIFTIFTSDGTAKTAHVTAAKYVISVQLTSSENPEINPNLIFEADGTGILTVEKAELTVTVKDVSREYGESNPELSVSYSGFIDGEDESVLGGELILKYDKHRINEKTAVGPYLNATTAEGLTSDNYNINYVSGNVNITKIKVNASAGTATRTYLSAVFDKSLEGLAAGNFIIKDSKGNTVTVNNITASSDGKTYTLIGNFEVGREHTVKVVLSGADVDATHQLTTDTFAVTPIRTNSGGGLAPAAYTVSFVTNGESELPKQTVSGNTAIKEPTTPTKEGFDFAGWYTDKELKEKYDFSAKVTKNITLYAAWTEKDNSENQIILTIGEKDALVFGTTETNDVAPKVVNDRTMLPARFVAENLDADVSWNGEKELVTIKGKNLKTSEDITILIYIDSDIAYVNGKEIKLDSPAFIENERTYTPVRFISEELGASVEWIGAEQKVVITKTMPSEK